MVGHGRHAAHLGLLMSDRRRFLLAGVGTAWPLLGCQPPGSAAHVAGGFTGIDHVRGHLLQSFGPFATGDNWPVPTVTRKTDVLIAGGGVAGLAAARALRLKGVEDFTVLELEDAAGGNSRAGVVNGIPCPLGAHYLPLPGDDAWEVQNLLEELGLRQRVAGRWVYDERHLCHSPQERLFFNGEWQEGLLPLQGVGPDTVLQYRKFAALVAQARAQTHWSIPAYKQALVPAKQALAAITFEAYLTQHGLTDPQLRWYLNYCCCDDYGAGLATVSAWAGVHYFASRHGFAAPGLDTPEREALLTWPQGNAWLTQRLAAPLKDRLHTGQVLLRIANVTHGVQADVFNTATQAVERWQAGRAIVALPIFVAARVVQNPPDWLRQAAAQVVYAPWLVANLHLSAPLHDRPGAPPAWDSVLYGNEQTAPGLGYVDAMHQSLQPVPGATVLSYYRALGDVREGVPVQQPGLAGRRQLFAKPWAAWRDAILAELASAHPDMAAKTTRIDITRYGHAMAVPVPRVDGQIGLWSSWGKHRLLQKTEHIKIRHGRLVFAHSDWAGYSVFEEAFTLGHHAA